MDILENMLTLFTLAAVAFLAARYTIYIRKRASASVAALRATEYMCKTSYRLFKLRNERDIEDAETQAALRTHLAALIDFRDTHPKIDIETRIAKLSKHLRTVRHVD
ncbi:MAG TPA: hypothetical protein VJK04_04155 [Candidatus Paceibacterota bacterium]